MMAADSLQVRPCRRSTDVRGGYEQATQYPAAQRQVDAQMTLQHRHSQSPCSWQGRWLFLETI
jgi:hypothetical protein